MSEFGQNVSRSDFFSPRLGFYWPVRDGFQISASLDRWLGWKRASRLAQADVALRLACSREFFGEKLNKSTWTTAVLVPEGTVVKDKLFSACNILTGGCRLQTRGVDNERLTKRGSRGVPAFNTRTGAF